jgi:hypothetical protein
MAAPVLVQQNTVATSTNGPASIAAALSGASTAGNFLVMVVAVLSSNPDAAITTPAGWTLVSTILNAASTRLLKVFTFPNCTVLTTVTVTITNTTGSAVAYMAEFSGMGTNPPIEQNTVSTGTADGASIPPAKQFTPPTTIGAIWLYALNANATYTPANTQEFGAAQGGVATVATALARLTVFVAITNGPGQEQNGGTLTNTNIYCMAVIRFSGTSGPIGYGAGGVVQTLAGNGSPNMFGGFSNG